MVLEQKKLRGKIMILIVEDDEILLRALYLLFHDDNYTIATASDGETAIKMAQRLKPDLILLDLLIPKMDGFEVLKDLKGDPEFKDLPIIVLSNLGSASDVERAKGLGATDYFIKAKTDLMVLKEKIEKLF